MIVDLLTKTITVPKKRNQKSEGIRDWHIFWQERKKYWRKNHFKKEIRGEKKTSITEIGKTNTQGKTIFLILS